MRLSLKFNCPARWSSMVDCGRSRFCNQCSKNVHDISQLSETEALQHLQEPETCARMELNEAGQIRTRNGFSNILVLSTALSAGCIDTKKAADAVEILTGNNGRHSTAMGGIVRSTAPVPMPVLMGEIMATPAPEIDSKSQKKDTNNSEAER